MSSGEGPVNGSKDFRVSISPGWSSSTADPVQWSPHGGGESVSGSRRSIPWKPWGSTAEARPPVGAISDVMWDARGGRVKGGGTEG